MNNTVFKLFGMALFFVPMMLSAQETAKKWDLATCIDYAKVNNLDIRQSRLMLKSAQEDFERNKAALLPSLDFSTDQTVSNTPYKKDNTYTQADGTVVTMGTDKTTYSGRYTLSASATLYQGGILRKNIKQAEMTNRTQELDIAISENDIEMAIAEAYIQTLYAYEGVKIGENTVENSKAQLERSQALLEAGSISKVDYAQIESQYSNDKYQLVNAQTTLANDVLRLKILLQLGINDGFDIDYPAISDDDVMMPVPDKNLVYERALESRPEIAAGRLGIESAELSKKIAQGGYYPSLSASANVNTSHSTGLNGGTLKENVNQSVGLSLRMPIYSRRENKTSVRKASYEIENSNIKLQNTENVLLQNIESVYLDAVSAQLKYQAASENLKSVTVSYNYVQEQFNLGMKNTVDLLTEKNNFLTAQQEQLQAKFMAILNKVTLNFYQGLPIELK